MSPSIACARPGIVLSVVRERTRTKRYKMYNLESNPECTIGLCFIRKVQSCSRRALVSLVTISLFGYLSYSDDPIPSIHF